MDWQTLKILELWWAMAFMQHIKMTLRDQTKPHPVSVWGLNLKNSLCACLDRSLLLVQVYFMINVVFLMVIRLHCERSSGPVLNVWNALNFYFLTQKRTYRGPSTLAVSSERRSCIQDSLLWAYFCSYMSCTWQVLGSILVPCFFGMQNFPYSVSSPAVCPNKVKGGLKCICLRQFWQVPKSVLVSCSCGIQFILYVNCLSLLSKQIGRWSHTKGIHLRQFWQVPESILVSCFFGTQNFPCVNFLSSLSICPNKM